MKQEKPYYVYIHSIGGVVFYVGRSQLRNKRGGQFRTEHERAYIRGQRSEYWKGFVKGRKVDVLIVDHFYTVEEAAAKELELIGLYADTVVNKLGNTPIYQFDKNGVLLKKWSCPQAASEELNIDYSSIVCTVLGLNPNRKTAGGFYWSNKPIPPDHINKIFVLEQRNLNGDLVGYHMNFVEASKFVGTCSSNSIRQVVTGKQHKAYGHKWAMVKYMDAIKTGLPFLTKTA